MAKPTGFIEVERKTAPYEDPKTRVARWTEFAATPPEPHIREQASRCMDCGVPFCQSDTGCPIDNLIPEWNDLVWRGRWEEASERLHRTNNFPEFTGRVCPAPCEGACTLGIAPPGGGPQPVTIKAIEVAIVDRGFDMGWIRPDPALRKSGFKVAVVGSGPAGLAAAQQLARAGHAVTVYEKDDRIGGLLTYGIPNMKLEKRLVERRVNQLRAEGVRFVTGADVGVTVSADTLRREHHAVLLAVGAGVPRDLDVPGRDAQGIHFAMPYLTAATRAALEDGTPPAELNAEGRRVLVIGGGDTGTDCLGTAVRQGAKAVQNLELLTRPPASRAADNPWPQWPRIFRSDYGHDEVAARFGADPRLFGVLTTRFLESGGKVTGVETEGVTFTRGPGGWQMVRVPNSTQRLEADLVLLAMGFTGAQPAVAEAFGVAQRAGQLAAPLGSYETNVPGVFAAGDARRGQSLVVWAIAEGRGAARAIDLWLMGETTLPAPVGALAAR